MYMKGLIETARGEASLLITAFKREGFVYVIREGLKYAISWPVRLWLSAWFRLTRHNAKFAYQGKEYKYLYHSYNSNWSNDRAIEIPLAWEIVQNNNGRRTLDMVVNLAWFTGVVDNYCGWIGWCCVLRTGNAGFGRARNQKCNRAFISRKTRPCTQSLIPI